MDMGFFKSFGRDQQCKGTKAVTTAVDAEQQKVKGNDSLPSQHHNQQPHDDSSTTGPSFRQVRWESSSPTDPVSSSESVQGGERSPFDTRQKELLMPRSPVHHNQENCDLHVTQSPGLERQQDNRHGQPLLPPPPSFVTPEEQQYVVAIPSMHEGNRQPQNQRLAESFAARTHTQKPSLGRRGAVYVSANRQRHGKSSSAVGVKEHHKNDYENGVKWRAFTRDPPKSAFLGNNMKRWEAILASGGGEGAAAEEEQQQQQHIAPPEDHQPSLEMQRRRRRRRQQQQQQQQRQESDEEGEPSGIGNRANEEAVEAVRKLGRGEFQPVFTEFERANNNNTKKSASSATQPQTRSRNAETTATTTRTPKQPEEPGSSSRHRSRSI